VTAGTANFVRREWDREEYERRAAERKRREEEGEEGGGEEEVGPDGRRAPAPYRPADAGVKRVAGSERGYLQARSEETDLERNLYKRRERFVVGRGRVELVCE